MKIANPSTVLDNCLTSTCSDNCLSLTLLLICTPLAQPCNSVRQCDWSCQISDVKVNGLMLPGTFLPRTLRGNEHGHKTSQAPLHGMHDQACVQGASPPFSISPGDISCAYARHEGLQQPDE